MPQRLCGSKSGTSIKGWDRAAYERGVELVRSELPPETFTAAWSAGAAWPLEAIFAAAGVNAEVVAPDSPRPAAPDDLPAGNATRGTVIATASAPLVGRDRELATLRAALDSAARGQGKVLLVGGAAGVGKTTLAAQFCREAADGGIPALVGRCYDLSDTPPYGLWIELFRQLPADLAPAPAAIDRFLSGESVSAETFVVQIRDYLAASATYRPIIILLDDVQWADPASLDLLRALARQVTSLPVVLIVTYRLHEMTREHSLSRLVPLLEREAQAMRIDLRPLSREAVTAMANAEFGLAGADLERLVSYSSIARVETPCSHGSCSTRSSKRAS